MQKRLVLISSGVIGIAAFWILTDTNEQERLEITVSPVTVNENSEPVDVSDLQSMSDTSSSTSPFAVVQETSSKPTVDVSDAKRLSLSTDKNSDLESGAKASLDNHDDSERNAQEITYPSIVVPKSYPASEADNYFIPAEKRGPGNLGGPPPLPFSDPAVGPTLPEDSSFTPPTVLRQ